MQFLLACLSIDLVVFTGATCACGGEMRQHITNTATALAFVAVMFLGVRCPAATNPVVFNGVGASVLFNTFALAADSATGCGTNIWTYKKGASGIDSRSAQI